MIKAENLWRIKRASLQLVTSSMLGTACFFRDAIQWPVSPHKHQYNFKGNSWVLKRRWSTTTNLFLYFLYFLTFAFRSSHGQLLALVDLWQFSNCVIKHLWPWMLFVYSKYSQGLQICHTTVSSDWWDVPPILLCIYPLKRYVHNRTETTCHTWVLLSCYTKNN